MNNILFNVLSAVIVALIGIIVKDLLPYLKTVKKEAMERIRATRWAWAADIIDAVVRAVEQTVSDEIHGADKKAIALQYIEPFLQNAGICLTAEEIDRLLEAAVQAMNANTLEVGTYGTDI